MAGIGEIAKRSGVDHEEVSKVIEAIRGLIETGERVTIQDFGTFDLDVQDQREGRNPQTGDPVTTPAKMVPKWTPNQTFKKRIAETAPIDQAALDKKRAAKEAYYNKQKGEAAPVEKPAKGKAKK